MNTRAVVIVLIIAVGVALIIMSLGKGDKAPRPALVVEGYPAPEVSLVDANGNIWLLSKNRGNVVLFNFWATWCDTCKEEMPSLQRLYDAHKEDPRFKVVMVPYNEEPSKAAAFLEENGYTLPHFVDTDGLAARAFGLTGVPETYIVGKEGILRKKIIGPAEFDNPKASDYIARLLQEGS